jgi:hypothetical protein
MMTPMARRHPEEQLKANGGADDLGKIGGDDRSLGENPQADCCRAREAPAAGLGEIEPGPETESGAKRLQENRHDIGDQGDGEELVAEGGAAGERGCPVSRVHIAGGDQIARADKAQKSVAKKLRWL